MVFRRASHAGSWYSGSKKGLEKDLNDYFTNKTFGPGEEFKSLNLNERTTIGGTSPHAGYTYSGPCAAWTYLNLFKEKIPDTVIILGTDHIGHRNIALMKEGVWETPLGNLEIDSEVSNAILDNSDIIVADDSVFTGFSEQEHNIEIQLPFIKYCAGDKDVKIVTIKVAGTKDFKTLDKISSDIGTAIKKFNKDIVIVASSDMSHKQVNNTDQLKEFKEIDYKVIDEFQKVNPEKTLKAALSTTICGPQTITSLLLIGKNLGISKGKLLKYYASSEITGKIGGYCVGYFSGVIIK